MRKIFRSGYGKLPKRSTSTNNGAVMEDKPSTPDDANSSKSPEERARELLKFIIQPEDNTATAATKKDDKLDAFGESVKDNLTFYGFIGDKIGGLANNKAIATQSENSGSFGTEAGREISNILTGLGSAHIVGAIFLVVGHLLDRWVTMGKNKKDLENYRKSLSRMAKHVTKLEQLASNTHAVEFLQAAFEKIFDHAAFCNQMMHSHSKSLGKRFCFATKHKDKIAEMQKDMDDMYRDLILAAWYADIHGEQDTKFEPSEDTVLVGIDKLVEDKVLELEPSDQRVVRALVVTGLPGVGKSSVGGKIAERVIKKYGHHVCMLDITVLDMHSERKIQALLYKKLSPTGVKMAFSNAADGRKHLQKLFSKLEKPVLIFFDNVLNFTTIEELLPKDVSKLPAGSLILVTTTNQQVINVLEEKGARTSICEVHGLEEEQARDLLLKEILGDVDMKLPSDLSRELMRYKEKEEMMLRKLLRLCGELPLAIMCVGSHISRRGQNYLRDTGQNYLRDTGHWPLATDLHNPSLKEAYAQLFEHRDVQEGLVKKLKDAVLHACNSLSQGDPMGTGENTLDQSVNFACQQLSYNPLLQEAFLSIVHLHVGRDYSEVELLCGAELVETLRQLSLVRRLVYKDGTLSPILNVHHVLIGAGRRIANVQFEGRWLVREDGDDDVVECFHNYQLERRLHLPRFIKLDHCDIDLPAEKLDYVTTDLRHFEVRGVRIIGDCSVHPRMLECLKIERCPLPFLLHNLQKLKFLYLDFENTTSNLECIQNMPSLAKVTVKNSTTLRCLGSGLPTLSEVSIFKCSNFESIEGLNPLAVRQLEIASCPEFRDFLRVGLLSKLTELYLVGCQHSEFPEDFEIPSGVQDLDFSRNYKLTVQPRNAPGNKIRKLNLGCCTSLTTVSVIDLKSLEYLVLGGCSKLENLTLSDENLKTLKHLEVQGCASSKLKQSIASLMNRFPPSLRLIQHDWLEEQDEECTAPTRCELLTRCIKLNWRKRRTVKFRGRCFTFPPNGYNRKKDM
ncbi:hypothetical protein AXG93_1056s1000 [Marchantia polymorpha subsp. ruderalis]|uniref:NB-ARC domain-containing protein n=1 Tax=Marchantia polymorpha subsp. ruderalis TaxID=1480154 RepID=A0A176VLD7_MARPO|nr:hypothetical protein AXG93_1056s1000 [Marchantia polymorpha subsp. ruderalis]